MTNLRRSNKPTTAGESIALPVPAHSREAEMSVLGAVMMEQRAVEIATALLPLPEQFYFSAHQTIWSAVLELQREGSAVDIVTLTNELRRTEQLQEIGGSQYLGELILNVPTAAYIRDHARIIVEHAMKRRLVDEALRTITETTAPGADAFEVTENAQLRIDQLAQHDGKEAIDEIANRSVILDRIHQSIISPDLSRVTPTGFYSLDKIISGFLPQELIIVAGRPGSGKSALAQSMAWNMAERLDDEERPMQVAYFSLEMTYEQMMHRQIGWLARIDISRFRRSDEHDDFTAHEYKLIASGIDRVKRSGLLIDSTSRYTIPKLRRRLGRLIETKNVRIAFVDYLGKMKRERGHSKSDEIEEIAQSLKAMAKEFDIPIVALAQLNRDVENRTPPRPKLDDLRDSGALEQEADMVLMSYRPEYYNPTNDLTKACYEDGDDIINKGDVQVGKMRQGGVGTARLAFLKQWTRWENLAEGLELLRENERVF